MSAAPLVLKENGRYVVRYNGLILVTALTAQAIANYLQAMNLVAKWNIDPNEPFHCIK